MVLCKPLRFGLIHQPPLDSISEDGSEPFQVVVCVAAMPPFSLGEGKTHVNLIFIGSKLALAGGILMAVFATWLFGKVILAETVLPS